MLRPVLPDGGDALAALHLLARVHVDRRGVAVGACGTRSRGRGSPCCPRGPFEPTNTTGPAAAATMSVPGSAAMSSPAWN